jgi:hypothetical protein
MTGTRAIPEAAENCMGNMAFVMTGEFETITRDQVTDIIKRYGGRCGLPISLARYVDPRCRVLLKPFPVSHVSPCTLRHAG